MSAGFLNPMAGLGGNMPADPTGDLIARQKLAELLSGAKGRYNDTSPKQHPYQALAQVADGAFEGMSARQQLAAALAGQAQANSLSAAMPIGGGAGPATPASPAAAGRSAPVAAAGSASTARAPGELAALFDAKEKQYGLPAGYLHGTAGIETGGKFNADAHNKSGADGIFQFIPSTASAYGVNTRDVASSTDGAARYARDNADRFRTAMGREPTAGELYLMHQQGEGGGLALLQNPDKPAGSVASAKNILANGGDPNAPASAFIAKWGSRFGGGAPAPTQQAAADPKADLPVEGAEETGAPGGELPRTADGFAIPPGPNQAAAAPDDLRAQLQAAFDAKRAGGAGPDTAFTAFAGEPQPSDGDMPSTPAPGPAAPPMPQPGQVPSADIAALMSPKPMGAPQGFTRQADMPAQDAAPASMTVPLPPQRPSDEALAAPARQPTPAPASPSPGPVAPPPQADARARLAQVLAQPRTDAPDPQSMPGQPPRDGIVQSLMGGFQDGLDRVFGGPQTQARLDAQGGGSPRARLAEVLAPPAPRPTAYSSLPAGGGVPQRAPAGAVSAPGPSGTTDAGGANPSAAPAGAQASVQVADAGAPAGTASSTQQQQVAWAQRVMAASANNPAVAKLVPLASKILEQSIAPKSAAPLVDSEGNYGQYDAQGNFHTITSAKDRKEKEDKYTYQAMPGVGMVALHPTDPDKSKVIIAGQQPRALTASEQAAFKGGYMGADGTPHIPNAGVTIAPGESETQKRTAALRMGPQEEAVSSAATAKDERAALAVMSDAIAKVKSNGGKLPEGKYGEVVQGFKSAARTFGIDLGNVPEGEILNKMNALLASAQAKALTSRPTQFDFQVMLERSPGLSQTDEGRVAMIQIFDQLAKRREEVGQIARHRDTTPDNFDDKVRSFDEAHPILSPFTGKPMRKPEDLGMPGQDKGATGTATPPPPPISRADLEAEARRRGLIR